MRQVLISNLPIGAHFAVHDGSITGELLALNGCEATVLVKHIGESGAKQLGWSLQTMVVFISL